MSKKKQSEQDVKTQGSRFFSCLMIAGVFIVIDLVILFYFFRPGASLDCKTVPSAPPPAIEQSSQPAPSGAGTGE